MNIGFLGGTFDPIHIAHLAIAQQAVTQLNLARVVFVPVWIAPHKTNRTGAAERARHRLRMLELALADNDAFVVSDIELRRRETSYTVDTLNEMRVQYSADTDIFLLIGADNYVTFDSWRATNEISRLSTVAIYRRPGCRIDKLAPSYRLLEGPQFDITSTWLRQQVAAGNSIRYCVPEPVRQYTAEHGLYAKHEE